MKDVFWLPQDGEPPIDVRYGEPNWPYAGDAATDRSIRQLAESWSNGRFYANPVVVEGSAGAGKSLLARALLWISERSMDSCRWIRAADWKRSYTHALDSHTMAEWRNDLLSADAIFMDDLHHLFSDAAGQRVLESLLDEWIQRDTRVVFTLSNEADKRIGLTHRLASRLSEGLSVQVQPPGASARLWLVRRFLVERGAPDAGEHVSQLHSWWNEHAVRVSEVRSLVAELIVRSPSLTPADLCSTFHALTETSQPAGIEIADIARLVARRYSVSLRDIRGVSRRRSTVRARAAAMWLARKWTQLSYHRIGEYFHKRDHSTVMHACRTFDQRLKEHPPTRQVIASLECELKAKNGRGKVVNNLSPIDHNRLPVGSS